MPGVACDDLVVWEMHLKEKEPVYDPNGETQPYWFESSISVTQTIVEDDGLGRLQPIRIPRQRRQKRKGVGCGGCALLPLLMLLLLVALYFLAPLRTNLLILGVDRVPEGTALGRSDTIILMTVIPLQPTVKMLSIPRDLYINIPGVGENRINTVHFFAEADRPGSGPRALAALIRAQFGVAVHYFVRIRFDGFVELVEAMGGVTIDLSTPMGGYPAGRHTLNGEQALAFVRDRAGTDDFFRMRQAQVFLQSAVLQMISPANWGRLPAVATTAFETLDTNVPVWQYPRLGLALVRASMSGIDSRTLDRTMVTPYATPGGAQVLLPQWERIRPLVNEMFVR